MNVVDIIILVCFIPAVISGFKKGFISQVISIVSIVLGAWLSFKFAGVVAVWIGQNFEAIPPQILLIVAFIVIFAAVFTGLYFAGKFLDRLAKFILLGWLNKMLGIIFAMLKYALFIALAILAFETVNSNYSLVSHDILDNSMMYAPLKSLADLVFPYIRDMIAEIKLV